MELRVHASLSRRERVRAAILAARVIFIAYLQNQRLKGAAI
jgi:hypothetical protein